MIYVENIYVKCSYRMINLTENLIGFNKKNLLVHDNINEVKLISLCI